MLCGISCRPPTWEPNTKGPSYYELDDFTPRPKEVIPAWCRRVNPEGREMMKKVGKQMHWTNCISVTQNNISNALNFPVRFHFLSKVFKLNIKTGKYVNLKLLVYIFSFPRSVQETSLTRLHLTRLFSARGHFVRKIYFFFLKKHPAAITFSTLLPSNYGGKEENMFSILSHSLSLFLSLHKLTAHHKSISAWRKSISRLPLLSDQKKCLILFFFF